MTLMSRFLPVLLLLTTTMVAGAQQKVTNGDVLPLVADPEAFRAAERARNHQLDVLLSEGRKAMEKGDLARAIELLQQADKVKPGLPEAPELLADIYIQQNRPAEVVQTLGFIFSPANNNIYSDAWDESLRMKYVLALLDTSQWEEAATVYEQLLRHRNTPLLWAIPGIGMNFALQEHTLPQPHFSPEHPDAPALRAQAHLILGTRLPRNVEDSYDDRKRLQYMLAHLQQALKSDRHCVDAAFLSGVVLGKMQRFAQARAAFAQASEIAPRAAQSEIKAALEKLKQQEEWIKFYNAQHPDEAAQAHSSM